MPSLGSYLQPVLDTGIQLKDYAHASRLYADNVFALTPKAGWLYYVVFDIEPFALTDETWDNQQRTMEVGMLVKSADLPKFTMNTEVVNQYNRKTVIQKNITYNPITLALHDDQSNVTHNMWLNYYRYYFSDSRQGGTGPIGTARDNTPGAFENNKYLPPNGIFNPVNYGLNSELVIRPFFRSITIYQLNRKIFTSFKIVNPIIQSWEHDRVDQTAGSKLAESKMSVMYEAVFYGTGRVRKDTPSGFAMFHYDNSPSPLSIAGGGNNSVFGPGGVVPGALELFGDVSGVLDPDSRSSPLDILGAAIKGTNLVRNARNITRESLRTEGYAILNRELRKASQGGLNGLGFNLQLFKDRPLLEGQFLGTPVAVVAAQGIGQDFAGGTTTQSPVSNGTAPTSANSADASARANAAFANSQAAIDGTEPNASTTDNAPDGSTPAGGAYFLQPQPLSDTAPYRDDFIDELSAPEDVDLALNQLNASWAADNEYVNSQSLNPDEVNAKLSYPEISDAEHAAIKAESDAVFNTTREIQASVDRKYQSEYTRLTTLKQKIASNTTGSNNTQSEPDASSSEPSPESDAVPPSNEE
jgi:hypothetical protein